MAPNYQIRPTVLIPLRNHRAFLEVYFHQGELGGVFAAGNTSLAAGKAVEVEIAFAEEQMVLHTRGVVRWKRLRATRMLPAGIGIELSSTERRTRDLLLDFAKGRSVQLVKRSSRRYPVVLEVSYASDSVFLNDLTDDISREGAFVRTGQSPDPPPVGTRLQLVLKPPSMPRGIKLRAEVMWRRTEFEPGIGVRFIEMDAKQQSMLDELVTQIKDEMARMRQGA